MRCLKNYGYKKSKNNVGGTFGYRNNIKEQIVFYDTEEILKFDNNYDVAGISMQELKVIITKCEELWWI